MLKITTRQEAKESGRRGRKKNSQKKLLLLARVTPAPFGFCFLSSRARTIGRRPRDRLNRSYDDGMRVHWTSFRWLKATGRRDLFFFSRSTLAERRASERFSYLAVLGRTERIEGRRTRATGSIDDSLSGWRKRNERCTPRELGRAEIHKSEGDETESADPPPLPPFAGPLPFMRAGPLILHGSRQGPTEMHRENLHTRSSGIFPFSSFYRVFSSEQSLLRPLYSKGRRCRILFVVAVAVATRFPLFPLRLFRFHLSFSSSRSRNSSLRMRLAGNFVYTPLSVRAEPRGQKGIQ